MPSNVFSGMVQGVSKIATGTPAAWCRKVLSGTFTRNPNNARRYGIGGQVNARKGIDEVTLDITCCGVALADIARFFPTTAGVQVASFPDFLVEVDDGTNGQEWVLSGGQPVSCTISLGDGADAEVEYKFTMKFTTATEAAAGTDVPVYNSVLGHGAKDITVQIAAADQGVMSFDITNDLGTKMVNTLDTKIAGSHTIPTGYVVTTQKTTIKLVTSNVFKGSGMDGDEWVEDDITFALANGTVGENITITASNFIPDSWDMPLEAEGVVAFAHEFGVNAGTVFNRVTFA